MFFFAFLSIPLHSRLLLFRLIALFPFRDPKTIAKRNTFKCNRLHKKPSLSNSQFWIPSRDSPISKWTVLSGQLFIQFRFTPRLNKIRGSFFLCWISPIWVLYIESFFVRKSGTLRWHMEKTTAFFLVFFCISIHSSSFPFFVSYSLLFRLIALFPFRDPKTIAKRNTFKRNFSLPFQIPNLGSKSWIWFPSRDSPNSKWTVLSGQLFIQFPSIPLPTKIRGLCLLYWISPIWFL